MKKHEILVEDLIDSVRSMSANYINPRFKEFVQDFNVINVDNGGNETNVAFREVCDNPMLFIALIVDNHLDILYDANSPERCATSYTIESEIENADELHILDILQNVIVVTADENDEFNVWTSHMTDVKRHLDKIMLVGAHACDSMRNKLQRQIEELCRQQDEYEMMKNNYIKIYRHGKKR